MPHPNEELIRKGFEAYEHRDLRTIQESLHPEIVWHWLGRGVLAGDYRGVGEVLTMFAGAFERAGDSLHLEIHDILANDEHGVVLVRTTAQRGGHRLDDRSVFTMHFRDSKIAEVWTYAENQYVDDEFWSA